MKITEKFDTPSPKTALPVTNEFILDPHGVSCTVLDTDRIDFSTSVSGRKKATTRVLLAEGGEGTGQKFDDVKETFDYVAEKGDAIFVNSPTDRYVPPSIDGGRLKFVDLEKNGYKIDSGGENEVQVKSPSAQLLVGVVDARVCIKGAWGATDNPANHQFLSVGATLKKGADGKVTGIDKEGFEKWEVDPVQKPRGNAPVIV